MTRYILILLTTVSVIANSQDAKPKLVVGIVVDQMRQEYLYRFSSKFGNGGFKRLIGNGFMLRNAHYNYVPTVTGPGHSSIYTGTTPSIHGIIFNDWYDKESKKWVNCVQDDNVQLVGITKTGGISPYRLLTTTITDELKIATQKRSKVIGLSFKDRGAVLPAGHAADGAYWFDPASGKFISSTFYKPGLPIWIETFNASNLKDQLIAKTWTTTFPIDQYKESGTDDSPYEKFEGKDKPTFPYNLSEIRKASTSYELLTRTPFGDDLLTELAKTSIDAEELGKDDITDFLTISFSIPDAIGHAHGPRSIEIEDAYIRLDKNLEDLLLTLDKKVGQDQYLVFLTADHAMAEVPRSLIDMKIPAGLFNTKKLESGLNEHLNQYYPGVKFIESISNNQVFLDHNMFKGDPKSSSVDLLIVTQLITQYLVAQEGIAEVFTKNSILETPFNEISSKGMVARGFYPKRSGDIAFTYLSGWTAGGPTGSTHGSQYTYDTHVPILFYGWGINKGVSDRYYPVIDIAPTLSILLKIKFPSGCKGQPIEEVIKKN